MAKKRPPSMNVELLEYMKFLHLHNLVDIISIIESIPIYYQTQIKKYGGGDVTASNKKDHEYIKLQKLRLQNLTFIAQKICKFNFPSFTINYQTWRIGPYSLDLENECNNLIYSDVFNNAISSKKTFTKRYNIIDYDKKYVVSMFKHLWYYRKFLGLVEGKDIQSLRDLAMVAYFHSIYSNGHAPPHMHRYYVRSFANKFKLLKYSLQGLVSNKKDYENYICELIDFYFKIR
jgi:hypothetical protein